MYQSYNNYKVVESDRKANIAPCLYWDVDKVVDWIADIGFHQYKTKIKELPTIRERPKDNTFRRNNINGRKLIAVHASSLPRMGIFKFEDILVITKKIRQLLRIDEVGTSHYKTQLDPKYMYLQQKKHTGRNADNLSYRVFYKKNAGWFT